jgi:predicted nucleic acid-binding protein
VICAPVYAQLLAHPSVSQRFVDEFLADTNAIVDFELDKEVWLQAAKTFSAYVERRLRSGGGWSGNRLLGDFVIAAHVLQRADRLMTFDASRQQGDFPTLHIVLNEVLSSDRHYCGPPQSDFR